MALSRRRSRIERGFVALTGEIELGVEMWDLTVSGMREGRGEVYGFESENGLAVDLGVVAGVA